MLCIIAMRTTVDCTQADSAWVRVEIRNKALTEPLSVEIPKRFCEITKFPVEVNYFKSGSETISFHSGKNIPRSVIDETVKAFELLKDITRPITHLGYTGGLSYYKSKPSEIRKNIVNIQALLVKNKDVLNFYYESTGPDYLTREEFLKIIKNTKLLVN